MEKEAITISASMVKSLREMTGLGMMECKKALVESDGNIEQARDLLRIKSGTKADKVAGRLAAEGRIAFASSSTVGVLIEVNCETDFVARDENMIAFTSALAQAVVLLGEQPQDISTISLENGQTVEDARRELVMKVGENITINRIAVMAVNEGQLFSYLHTGDKIAAMCVLSGGDNELGQDICMHIAAMRPTYLEEASIPADIIANEERIFSAQAMDTGKPEDIAKKIALGKLKKYISDVTLLGQPFVKDTDKIIARVLSEKSAKIHDFCLLAVGETTE